MAKERFTVLIVEDQPMNREILRNIVETEYDVLEAENGRDALALLARRKNVSAILLDIVMPVMDGYTFLKKLAESPFSSLPVIVITGDKDEATEQKALDYGAWDFVSKPYQPNILLLRLKNVIVRSQYYLISEMQYAYEHDTLTGLCNRARFFADTRKLLDSHPGIRFALMRMDIDQFHIFNSYWGEEEGNRLLRYMADELRRFAGTQEFCTYGRINADTFCLCIPYDADVIERYAEATRRGLADYNRNYLIEPSFGVYIITHPEIKIEAMFECAMLAAKECKGSFITHLRYYQPEMNEKVLREQHIVNEMQHALDAEEFVVYLQPKYNLRSETPYGAEALIRWKHPERGLVSPGEFIPVFERNGFIGKVDYYMWEKVCALLRRWIDQGVEPAPVSVNMSRVNLYNPNLIAMLTELVHRYGIPPRLLNLELTESAYMENPSVMEKAILGLQKAGFIILMDDFGSGYSSLNTLKNIPVDVLKIDMKFLSGEAAAAGRNECILASVIRMAGWLEIPVIMEGVETQNQVEFLKSIGCGYVQGYYFAKPMPVADYEALVRGVQQIPAQSLSDNHRAMTETIWSASPQINLLFNSIRQPAGIYEFDNGGFHTLRVNASFNSFFGYGESISSDLESAGSRLSTQSLQTVLAAFRKTAETRESSRCDYVQLRPDGSKISLRLDLQYWGANEKAKILFALFTDLQQPVGR